jgi:clan AA aspartic protease (TIGR02281 family)
MVGLAGTVSGTTYRGTVDGYRCGEFSLSRQAAVSDAPVATSSTTPKRRTLLVPLTPEGGTFTVPVSINDKLTLNFVLDSGAADVSIPADVVLTLMRTGTLSAADFLGKRTYRIADGSTLPSEVFRIRSLRVGNRVLENVVGSVAPVEGGMLLGQSFLSRFKSWSIDNQHQVLILE